MYSRQIQADNSREISRLKRNLIRCLREDITSKQREMILMYYAEGKNMREIGESMGQQVHRLPDHQAGGAAAPALSALRRGGLSAQYGRPLN